MSASSALVIIATISCLALSVGCVKTRDFVELNSWLNEYVAETENVRADLESARPKIDLLTDSDENAGAKKAFSYLIELSQITDQLASEKKCDDRPLEVIRLLALILGKRPDLLRVKQIVTSFMNQVGEVCLSELIDSFKPMEESVKHLDRKLELFQRPEEANLGEILLYGQLVDGRQLGQQLYNLRDNLAYKIGILHLNYYREVTRPCNRHIESVERLILDLRDILSNQNQIDAREFIDKQSEAFKDALYIYAACKGAQQTHEIEIGFGRQIVDDMSRFVRGKIIGAETKQEDS